MLAVIKAGGKQYLVSPGQTMQIDKLEGEPGKRVEFSEVLLVNDGDKTEVGAPLVSGAKVVGKIMDQVKGKKLIVFKYKPKKRYRRKIGFRARYTKVLIEKIS